MLGERYLNACLTRLEATDGRVRHVVTALGGRRLEVWADEEFRCVQVYVCQSFPDGAGTGTCERSPWSP